MSVSAPETVLATYRVRADKEQEFVELLRRHHPVLHDYGLVTRDRPTILRGSDAEGRPVYYELFTWADGDAVEGGQQLEEVTDLWAAMAELVEERDGLPKIEYPPVRPLELEFVTD
jgi:Ser/Thr protein kinase RdoA (MazF antagonist)